MTQSTVNKKHDEALGLYLDQLTNSHHAYWFFVTGYNVCLLIRLF